MPPKRRPPPNLYGPLGPNGELQFPPLKPWAERERERLEALQKEKSKPKVQKEANSCLCRHLAKLSFELPRDPDQQKAEMIKITEEEHYRSLSEHQLPQFPEHLYKRAKLRVDKQTAHIKRKLLILTYQACVRQSEADIKEFFLQSMKRCLLSYILEDPRERARLQISLMPTLWPALVVRAPVPWHSGVVRARQAMFYRYYEGNPVLVELRRMWHERSPLYQNIFICDMNKMQEECPFPQYPGEFTERLNKLCADTRAELVDNWIVDVADTLIKMRSHWSVYVAKKKKASKFQVEDCIHGLMSKQIRDLVERSVYHFAEYFMYYFLFCEGAARPRPYLMAVYPEELYLAEVINKCVKVFSINRPGPSRYISMYQDYHYLLNGSAHEDLLRFFALDPPPYLKQNSTLT
ncbi:unnamed protein product [Leptidea sinapis]|uniref:Uncharacterized protein n=1 Tax=Leptidea sinapis TaxID=189913 RepID=A0A5E4QEN7_9NEOP|nr:unnamed protein product [Leptidea sinapis]